MLLHMLSCCKLCSLMFSTNACCSCFCCGNAFLSSTICLCSPPFGVCLHPCCLFRCLDGCLFCGHALRSSSFCFCNLICGALFSLCGCLFCCSQICMSTLGRSTMLISTLSCSSLCGLVLRTDTSCIRSDCGNTLLSSTICFSSTPIGGSAFSSGMFNRSTLCCKVFLNGTLCLSSNVLSISLRPFCFVRCLNGSLFCSQALSSSSLCFRTLFRSTAFCLCSSLFRCCQICASSVGSSMMLIRALRCCTLRSLVL
mmetsp:Transcript_55979/g.105289  ORF Transcript_55979/g.105289 Transcript_55979/m.105289 type:complete len:255 (+) Transcript_55979:745-1509(+)